MSVTTDVLEQVYPHLDGEEFSYVEIEYQPSPELRFKKDRTFIYVVPIQTPFAVAPNIAKYRSRVPLRLADLKRLSQEKAEEIAKLQETSREEH